MSGVVTFLNTHATIIVYAVGFMGLGVAIAGIILGIITAPERCREAEFFARKRREAEIEWNAREGKL